MNDPSIVNVKLNDNIKLNRTNLTYQREYGYGANTFYFICSNGHLGSYNTPISTFKGFAGTSRVKLKCYFTGCNFDSYVFLDHWLYEDPHSFCA